MNGSSGNMVQWGIQFTLDDDDLTTKVKAAKERTAALAKSIESGTYYQLQRAAISSAKEYDALIKKSSQLLLNEQRLAREAERRQKYGRLGVLYSMTERYNYEMQQRGYNHRGMMTGGMMRVGAVGTGMLMGAAAAGGPAVSDTVFGSMRMVGLTASRAMIPALATASKYMQEFADKIDHFVDNYPKLASSLGTAALVMAGIGAAGVGIRGIGYAWGGLKTAAAMGGSAWRATTGVLSTVGMIPPPPASTAGKSSAPMFKGNWTGGTAPTAQMAPAGSSVGSAVAGGAMAGLSTKSILGSAARVTGYGMLAYGANEMLGNPIGSSVDWIMKNHPFQNKDIDHKGNTIDRKKIEAEKEERMNQFQRGLGLSMSSFGAADYRDAAQSSVLGTTAFEAKEFNFEVKNWAKVAEEFGIVVEKMSVVVGEMRQANQPGFVPPGR